MNFKIMKDFEKVFDVSEKNANETKNQRKGVWIEDPKNSFATDDFQTRKLISYINYQ